MREPPPGLTRQGAFLSVACATKELKTRPPVYLEQRERSERLALGPPGSGGPPLGQPRRDLLST